MEIAGQAEGAGLTAGVPRFDEEKDAAVRSLPAYGAFRQALLGIPEIEGLYGPEGVDWVALAWIYERATYPASAVGWDAFEEALSDPNWRFVAFALLYNADMAPAIVALAEGVDVLPRDSQLPNRIGLPEIEIEWRFRREQEQTFGLAHSVLLTAEHLPKNPANLTQANTGSLVPRLQRALLALRLATDGDLAHGRIYFARLPFASFPAGWTLVDESIPLPSNVAYLSAETLLRATELCSALERLDHVADRLPNLQTALARLSASYGRPLTRPGDRIVDLMIALEAVAGSDTEIAHKLAFRVSGLLSDTDAERVAMFSTIRDFYSCRSALVHGGPLKKRQGAMLGRERELRLIVRRLLAGLLGLVGSELEPSRRFVDGPLDLALLDAERRAQLRQAVCWIDNVAISHG